MRERLPEQNPDKILPNTGTVSLERAFALEQVLGHFGLPFRIVAREGARYPDGFAKVPKGAAFVTYDTGEIPTKLIDSMVEEIAPTPTFDSGHVEADWHTRNRFPFDDY